MRFSFENPIEDVTYLPMVLYWCLGLHPSGNTSRVYPLLKYFNMIGVSIFAIFVVMGIEKGSKGSFIVFLESMQVWSSFFGCTFKYFVLSYRCYALGDLLEESKKFWKVSEFGNAESSELLRKVKFFIRSYVATGVILMTFQTAVALWFGVDVINIHRPEGYDTGLNIARFWMMYVLGSTAITFSIVFFGICAELYVQIQLLASHIKTLDDDVEQLPIKLNRLVAHHSFLLKFFGKINAYGKEIFVAEFAFFLLGFCLEVFILSQDSIAREFGLIDVIKVAIYFLFQVGQLMSYVLPGHFLVDAFSQIGEVIYNECEWHTYHVTCQKALGVIMVAAQREITLNGYGLVVYDLETIRKIYKYVMAFYTSLKAVNEKSEIVG